MSDTDWDTELEHAAEVMARDDEPTERLRLLSVTVVPAFAIDDGHGLTPVEGQPIVVPSAKWAEFAANSFTPAELAALLIEYRRQVAPKVD